MLNIVHTENSCGWGGQELRILGEMEGMLARGHRVTLVCPPESRIHTVATTRGLPTQALPIARKRPSALRALRRWLHTQGPIDLLNSHSSTDSWLSALACATMRSPPILVRTRHVSTPVHNNPPTRWLYLRATRHIVTTGERLRRQLHETNGIPLASMTSIPTGIDLQRFAPMPSAEARTRLGLPPHRHHLGIVATLRSWKGHEDLLASFARLVEDFPEWDLLLVGDGPQRRNLERLTREWGLSQRIRFTGNREDVPMWLNAMDLFVLPSYGNEGVPQSIMQAMACGLPVVSTSIGAIQEAVIAGETGLIVPPRDVEALESALRRLMGDVPLRRRLGTAGLERARARFGIETMLDRVEELYGRLLEDRAP